MRHIPNSSIERHDDGAAVGMWSGYALHSAFQPIFAFAPHGLHCVAFEALLRPYRDGLLLPVIEFLCLISPGDRFEVEDLARTIHLLNAGVFLPQQTSVFLNLDPSLLNDANTMRTALYGMQVRLREAGLQPSDVVCEVTEQHAASQSDLSRFADCLRDQNIVVAVDDFGAASSDMERVRLLRPDIVKFDGRWVARHLGSRTAFDRAVRTLDGFREQGLSTVFEGIEHEWQVEQAEACGADMVQGYALGRPELAAALPTFAAPANDISASFSVSVPANNRTAR